MDMYMEKFLGDLPDLSPYSPKQSNKYISQVEFKKKIKAVLERTSQLI